MSKVFASLTFINDNVLDVSTLATIPYKLHLEKYGAGADYPLAPSIFNNNDFVCLSASREDLIKSIHELLF